MRAVAGLPAVERSLQATSRSKKQWRACESHGRGAPGLPGPGQPGIAQGAADHPGLSGGLGPDLQVSCLRVVATEGCACCGNGDGDIWGTAKSGLRDPLSCWRLPGCAAQHHDLGAPRSDTLKAATDRQGGGSPRCPLCAVLASAPLTAVQLCTWPPPWPPSRLPWSSSPASTSR